MKKEPLWSKLHSKSTLSAQHNKKSKNKSIVTGVVSQHKEKGNKNPENNT